MRLSSQIYSRSAKSAVAPLLGFALCLTGFSLADGSAEARTKNTGYSLMAETKTASAKRSSVKKTNDEIKAIALKLVPGKAVEVEIEKKFGANRYVVTILSEKDGGAEVDVILNMDTYKAIWIDKSRTNRSFQ